MEAKCKKGYHLEKNRCVRKGDSLMENMSNGKGGMWLSIIIFGAFILSLIIVYGGSSGWFTTLSVVSDEDIVGLLNSEELQSACTIDITPSEAKIGEEIVGKIIDGSNSLCRVFVNDGDQWINIFNGYSDSVGVVVNIRTIASPGEYKFRAICDANDNNRIDSGDCITPTAQVTINA